jgi:hypothetical protein
LLRMSDNAIPLPEHPGKAERHARGQSRFDYALPVECHVVLMESIRSTLTLRATEETSPVTFHRPSSIP